MRFFVFICFLSLAICGCSWEDSSNPTPKVVKGVLDLSRWNFDKTPLIALDGEWEFSAGLVPPTSRLPEVPTDYIQVPDSWNKFIIQNRPHGGEGTGTYRLKILFARPISNLALQIGDVSTAFRLYVNGNLVHENGKVGSTKAEMLPSYKHPIILLPEGKTELDLLLQVSNFYHITGGIRKSAFLGTSLEVFEAKKWEASLGWVVFGSTFLMGIYHLILFALRRVDKSAIWFGLFCIDVSLRGFFTGSVFVYETFPDVYWVLIHKLDLLTTVIALPLFSEFLRYVFPLEFHKYSDKAFLAIGVIFSAIVVVFPSTIYMNLIRGFQVLLVISIVYFLFIMILALLRRREGSLLFSFGALILFFTTLNDILNQALLIKTSYIANWGLLAFLFSQTVMLSLRFSNAFVRLEELQKSLETKVEERTRELAEAKAAAENANSLKDTFISLVSHDLRSPIATVIGVLQLIKNDYERLDDQSILEWINRAEQTSTQSLEMIATLLDLNRLRSGTFHLENSVVYVYPEVERVVSKLWSQAKSKNIRIDNGIPDDAKMNVDRTLLAEIFINLLSNAIKFSREGDSIHIEFFARKDAVEFKVQDTGVGIPKEMISNLFSPEVKSTRLGTKNETGTGLGLPLVYSIIQAYSGEIQVESEVHKGTCFRFTIPQPQAGDLRT